MFEDSPVGIARADLDGRFVEANRAYTELVGYSNEQLRTLTLLDLAAEDDSPANAEHMEQLIRGGRRDFQMETRCRRKHGQIICIHTTVSLVPARHNSSKFILPIAQDT